MTHINDHKKIHLVGIGGCSMNGLAQILRDRGFAVQGSDANVSPFTERLRELGVPVTIGHSEENLGDADLVIYSAAIKPENVERAAAKAKGIPELERSVALGQLTEGYKDVIGIAGCHGKTTVTSMLAYVCEQGKPDATVHIGGFVDILQGGVRLGAHDMFITEACEYVESFLTLRPTVALINNIDDDHLDYYRDIDHIVEAFRKFLALLPEDGLFIGCSDDFRVKALLDAHKGKTLSYGMQDADYVPANIVYDAMGCPSFDLLYKGESLGRIELTVPGEHNIINAVAAAIVAMNAGASFEAVAKALHAFQNTRRRFEYFGERNGVRYYHDYAHHPSEINATLSAAARMERGKLWCVFQCNSYTRAKTLFCHDVKGFTAADEILVPDIFPGREVDDGSVHAKDMVAGISASGANATYVPTFEAIRTYLDEHAKAGDIVVTLGSGDVYKQTEKLL